MKTRLIFRGAARWDGGDVYPFDDTPFPRAPVRGDRVALPDDLGTWTVESVTMDFAGGLASEPLIVVVMGQENAPA